MPDFRSALYLGLRHAARTLRPWAQLTSGVPWALEAPPEEAVIARRPASLLGCETALLAPSTLHLYFDLRALASGAEAVLLERGTYSVGAWGAARAGRVRHFGQHDARSLQATLLDTPRGRPALIVVDGLAPGERGVGPLAAYARLAKHHGARMVIDDTQALGILGARPDRIHPYGHGGGGSLRFHQIEGSHVIVIASLAKGLGVPLAVIAGSRSEVEHYAAGSVARMHSSPASMAALRAAERALALNRTEGDARRARLARLVMLFRSELSAVGIPVAGGMFPVQTLAPMNARRVGALQADLARRDVHALAQRLSHRQGRICFLLNARHTRREVLAATAAVTELLAPEVLAA